MPAEIDTGGPRVLLHCDYRADCPPIVVSAFAATVSYADQHRDASLPAFRSSLARLRPRPSTDSHRVDYRIVEDVGRLDERRRCRRRTAPRRRRFYRDDEEGATKVAESIDEDGSSCPRLRDTDARRGSEEVDRSTFQDWRVPGETRDGRLGLPPAATTIGTPDVARFDERTRARSLSRPFFPEVVLVTRQRSFSWTDGAHDSKDFRSRSSHPRRDSPSCEGRERRRDTGGRSFSSHRSRTSSARRRAGGVGGTDAAAAVGEAILPNSTSSSWATDKEWEKEIRSNSLRYLDDDDDDEEEEEEEEEDEEEQRRKKRRRKWREKRSKKRCRTDACPKKSRSYFHLTFLLFLVAFGQSGLLKSSAGNPSGKSSAAGLSVLTIGSIIGSARGVPLEPIGDPGIRAERSANLSHITGASRKIQMYIKNRHLQILPDGTVNGSNDDTSDYTIFQRTSVSRGQLRIQGVATCLYLCMDSCGLLYGSREYTEDCVFNETLEQHNYNTYSSVRWSTAKKTLYLGLNRRGQPRRVQAKGHNLGRLSAYARVLTQVAPPDRVEALQTRMLGAQHNVRHRHNEHVHHHHPRHRGEAAALQTVCPALPAQEKDGRDRFRCRKRKKRKKRKRRCRPGERPGPQCQTSNDGSSGKSAGAGTRVEGHPESSTSPESKRSCEGAASEEACRRQALSAPSKKRKSRIREKEQEEEEEEEDEEEEDEGRERVEDVTKRHTDDSTSTSSSRGDEGDPSHRTLIGRNEMGDHGLEGHGEHHPPLMVDDNGDHREGEVNGTVATNATAVSSNGKNKASTSNAKKPSQAGGGSTISMNKKPNLTDGKKRKRKGPVGSQLEMGTGTGTGPAGVSATRWRGSSLSPGRRRSGGMPRPGPGPGEGRSRSHAVQGAAATPPATTTSFSSSSWRPIGGGPSTAPYASRGPSPRRKINHKGPSSPTNDVTSSHLPPRKNVGPRRQAKFYRGNGGRTRTIVPTTGIISGVTSSVTSSTTSTTTSTTASDWETVTLTTATPTSTTSATSTTPIDLDRNIDGSSLAIPDRSTRGLLVVVTEEDPASLTVRGLSLDDETPSTVTPVEYSTVILDPITGTSASRTVEDTSVEEYASFDADLDEDEDEEDAEHRQTEPSTRSTVTPILAHLPFQRLAM